MRPSFVGAVAVCAAVSLLTLTRPAQACGIFGARTTAQTRTPSLLRERTLIIFDQMSGREHFVREARFSAGSGDFGFVVPVPALPEVAAVKDEPFTRLDQQFPVGHVESPELARARSGGGGSERAAAASEPVSVLESKRVGDFHSYVLAATDQNALAAWLKQHGFDASAAGTRWIAHYVKEHFFFVALKYVGSDQGLVSRTLRISFDSALPYYPYREPDDVAEREKRELEVWVVSSAILLPLANRSATSIARPWSEGSRRRTTPREIAHAVGPELEAFVLKDASIQSFADWKRGRRGWGDVVLAPELPQACDAACVERRRGLLDVLDPATGPRPNIAASELVVAAPRARVAVSRRPADAINGPIPEAPQGTGGCSLGGGHAGLGAGALLVFLVLAVRLNRRRRRLALAVLIASIAGCKARTPSSTSEPENPGSAITYALPKDPVARRKSLMKLLAGHYDEGIPRVDATPFGTGLAESDAGPLAACLPGVALEARVSWILRKDEPAGSHVVASGPVPGAVLDCVERAQASAEYPDSEVLASALPPEQAISLRLLRQTMWAEHYQLVPAQKPRPKADCNCDPGDPLCSCF